jgi:hypothetical protein
MTDDVKNLLSRALGQEPPLRIDRDEVIQQGRKRLRRRRMFEAGSVVAAVMVVAVGAATLTNLADSDPQRMPPAASRTQSAPPGPELPLPAPSSGPPGTTGSLPRPPSSETQLSPVSLNAEQLTSLLYSSDVVTRKDVLPQSNAPDGVPGFQQQAGSYVYRADLVRAGYSGSLEVTVDYFPGAVTDCAALPPMFGDCEIRGQGNFPIAISEWRGKDGERRTFAFTVRSDGTRVAAVASNITISDRDAGRKPKDVPPVLTTDELSGLVVKVGIDAG